MKKIKYLLPILAFAFVVLNSCKDDDDGVVRIPPHDRGEEAIIANDQIVKFLETHFYNYEEFENPTTDFNFRIVFDTIAGDNALKTPLIEQVDVKEVTDIFDEDVTYDLYYLKVNEGGGDEIKFTDNVSLAYEGRLVADLELFDSSVVPVPFDLTQIVNGLQSALIEFKGAISFDGNNDGTLTFEDFGNGAVFIPSGLAYFDSPPPSLINYSQLIFTFHTYLIQKGDHDFDGILSYMEDLDGDGFEGNDDTNGNGIPNFADPDDDGDGRLTKNETELFDYTINPGDDEPVLVEDEVEMYREVDSETGEITIYTVVLTDTNSDGTPDYLDNSI